MKKMKLAVLALVGVLAAGNAMAADDATLTVQANVIEACSFQSNALVDFTSIDPINPVNLSATTSDITIKCTNLTTYAVEDDGIRAMSNGTDTIAYSLTYDTAQQTANGTEQPFQIQVGVLASAYDGVYAGTYSGVTTFTFAP